MIAVSASKAFSLYSERTGLAIVRSDPGTLRSIRITMEAIARTSYSQPPHHGAAVVTEILTDPDLCAEWEGELALMRDHVTGVRDQVLAAAHAASGVPFLAPLRHQRGMFLQLPLSEQEMDRLAEMHGIWGTTSGRINVAGVPSSESARIGAAIAAVRFGTQAS